MSETPILGELGFGGEFLQRVPEGTRHHVHDDVADERSAVLPARIEYPLFAAALELFERLQPDPEAIGDAMRTAGLYVDLRYESFTPSFEKSRYLARDASTQRHAATHAASGSRHAVTTLR